MRLAFLLVIQIFSQFQGSIPSFTVNIQAVLQLVQCLSWCSVSWQVIPLVHNTMSEKQNTIWCVYISSAVPCYFHVVRSVISNILETVTAVIQHDSSNLARGYSLDCALNTNPYPMVRRQVISIHHSGYWDIVYCALGCKNIRGGSLVDCCNANTIFLYTMLY